MPAPEVRHLYQRALVWYAAQFDDYGQHKRSDSPNEIPVRWTDQASEATDPNGNNIQLQASIETTVDIPVGSVVWKGTLAQLQTLAPNTSGAALVPPGNLFEVATVNTASDIRNRVIGRRYGLKRLGDTMRTAV